MTDGQAASGPDGKADAILREDPAPGVVRLVLASHPLGVLRVSVKHRLLEVMQSLEADKSVRCVILAGSQRAFSVGSDIKEFRHEAGWLLAAEVAENAVNDHITQSRLPYIAALNGDALGGGLVLALACDLRVARRGVRLGLPEVRVGAFASGSGTQRLPTLIGRGRALLLLLTGRLIEADQALAMGLVEEIAETDADANALVLATEIAAMSPQGVAATKRCVAVGIAHGHDAGMREESREAVRVGLSEDAMEGQRAFIEKRPPAFRG